jgi:hypothetical protein
MSPAAILDVFALLVLDAFSAFGEAVLGDLLRGLILAIGHGEPIEEVALGEPVADHTFVARAAEHRQAGEDQKG